jgi:replicative superfamily II helicase
MKIGVMASPENITEQSTITNTKPTPQYKFTGLPPNAKQEECVRSDNFPYMSFPFEYFNPMQSSFLPEIEKDNNVIVCGKTSAGKTVIAETIFSYVLEEQRKTDPHAIVAYISPLKALASEKQQDWTNPSHTFSKYNLSILTGDYMLTEERKKELSKAEIICMSSEMLGSRIRRNNREINKWLHNIRTIVVDESHLLTVPERGSNLEVALMKFTAVNPKCRVVFLSATMPNVRNLGEWLTKLNTKQTTVIKSDYRPVDLNWNYEYYNQGRFYNETEKNKITKTISIVQRYHKDKFIVFVHSKKTGRKILKELNDAKIPAKFHNADLNRTERANIEESFKSREPGSLRVLVSTSSLAWGINTPARRVLIVGMHRGRELVLALDIIQMAGRAGRVGLDDKGDAHILISKNNRSEEINFCKKVPRITSQINDIASLSFHLVSEIVEGNVTYKETAIKWFERSLAYHQAWSAEEMPIDKLEETVLYVLEKLVKCGALTQDLSKLYRPTTIARISSWFYINPFDIARWVSNLKKVLSDKPPTESQISWALANTVINSSDWGINLTKEEEVELSYGIPEKNLPMKKGVMKHAYAIYNMLRGKDNIIQRNKPEVRAVISKYRFDSERIAQAIVLLAKMGGYFNGKNTDIIYELPTRLKYGLGNKGLELLLIPGVGKVTTLDLIGRRIYNCKDLIMAQNMGHKAMTDKKWSDVKSAVKDIARLGHIEYVKTKGMK